MKISYFCTTWGQKTEDWDPFFSKVSRAGYDGVETSLPPKNEIQEFQEGLDKYKLSFIGQHWETSTPDVEQHKTEYHERLRSLAILNPILINSHTGKDHFSFEENTALLNISEVISKETGIPIYHETHRGRFAFAAHITKSYLERNPSLELTLDISHWCAVAESLLQDQRDIVQQALERTRHIHARVGFEQGPQVPDFTQYRDALEFHSECWDKVIVDHERNGRPVLTITPEFGPPPYMQGVSDGEAVDKQWRMNAEIMRMLKDRYR